MAKSFDALVARSTSKEVRACAAALTRGYLAGMLLGEVRKRRGLSQQKLAALLRVKQPSLSKLEGQEDMHVSTLQKIVKALGGELILTARFADGDANLTQFERNRPATRKHRRPANSLTRS